MKTNNWKTIGIAISLFIGICGFLYGLISTTKLDKVKAKEEKQKQTVQAEVDKLVRHTDEQGRKHAAFPTGINTLPAKSALSIGAMDTTAKALKIREDQIEYLLQVNTVLTAENLKAKQKFDSLKRITYYYKDKYFEIAYRPGNPADTTDKGEFDLKGNADLNIVQYWKRNKILGLPIGSKDRLTDIYSNDPRVTIQGVKTLTIKDKEPYFGLLLQATANYNPETGSFGAGPTVRLDAGRWSFQLNRLYYPITNNWRWSVNGNFDLVRF